MKQDGERVPPRTIHDTELAPRRSASCAARLGPRRANRRSRRAQLLYEIYFFSLSESLPHASQRIHAVFRHAPAGVHAEYILGRHRAAQTAAPKSTTSVVTRALRFPLCTPGVLDALLRLPGCPPAVAGGRPTLPRRLFRELPERPGAWRARHPPLPVLEHLFAHARVPRPDPDSHNGYPLARAVRAGARPLVDFLLAHGADPARNAGIAVHLAIQRRDLALVRALVEPGAGATGGSGKRRRVPDRVVLGSLHLRCAVQADAVEVIDWLMREKGCMPDMKTFSYLGK
jgi:hypothetical protein